MEVKIVNHPVDCRKVVHVGGEYLHRGDNDSPYEVDNFNYCGKCHVYLPLKEEIDIDI